LPNKVYFGGQFGLDVFGKEFTVEEHEGLRS
jgi:hypothetical protein